MSAPDPIVEAVRADLLRRSVLGLAKYGVSLDRPDLNLRDWMQHFYEELLDAANYAKAVIVRLDAEAERGRGSRAHPPQESPMEQVTGTGPVQHQDLPEQVGSVVFGPSPVVPPGPAYAARGELSAAGPTVAGIALPQAVTVGRIVNFVLSSDMERVGEVRPAIVTRTFHNTDAPQNPGMSNLTVFLDGSNDRASEQSSTLWKGSVLYSETPKPGTWHWPTRA